MPVTGGDVDLARAVASTPGAIFSFSANSHSDLGRSLGIRPKPQAEFTRAGQILSLDALTVSSDLSNLDSTAVNMVIAGTPPDRLRWWNLSRSVTVTIDDNEVYRGPVVSVAVANGQFLRGLDLFPRGHPADGKLEVQIVHIKRNQRKRMRGRLITGTHTPHPDIKECSGREVVIDWGRPRRWEVDGQVREPVAAITVKIKPEAYWILL